MKQIMLVVISYFLFSLNLLAQDVAGVHVYSQMTKNQVIQKFGQPEEYDCRDSYMDEKAIYELYYYGDGDRLVFINGYLYSFDVSTERWSVLMNMIENGVKIGDMFSRLEPLNPKVVDWLDVSNRYYIPCGDFPLYIDVKDGIIIYISYETL